MQISRKKKIIFISAAVVGLLAIVLISSRLKNKEGEAVQTANITRRAKLESKVTASGDIRPVRYYDLTAEVAGTVQQIYVTEGDPVKKGQPLVRVDPTQFSSQVQVNEAGVRVSQVDVANQQVGIQQAENNVNQMKASLAGAEADLDRSKVDLQYSEVELNRYQQLVEQGLTTKSQFDSVRSKYEQQKAVVRSNESRVNQLKVQVKDSELAVERAKTNLRASEARVKQSQAQLNIQSDLLKKTTRYSPIDGVVSYLPVKVGQFVVANFSSSPLLTVADMSQINAEIKVDETDIADVQVGQKVKVKVDALGEIEIDGDVVEKGASAVTRSGQSTTSQSANSQEARDFLVKIRLNPTQEVREKLRPGMSTTAVITTATRDNVITAPLQAIVPREAPNGDSKSASEPVNSNTSGAKKKEVEGVFIFGKDGRAQFTPVTTGIKGDQDIEIKSGLNDGDEIITGPYKTLRNLKDKDQVKREAKPIAPETK
ncbi:MAG: HlyD family secretion protein [Acidobacteria bacterium]|nr:HlyD family secretion protein [Acidobacteriota bacterium]